MKKTKLEDMPGDVLIERELIGSLLLKKGELIPKVSTLLTPDDFLSPINSTIYQTILELYSRDFLPNTLLILDELRKRSDYADNEKLYIEVVLEIEQSAFTTAYFESQVQVIKDKSVRRQLILFAERLSRDANNPQSNCDQLLSNAESVIHSVGGESTTTALISQHSYLSYKLTEDIAKNKLYTDRKTGFGNIDDCQIFSPGLYVIGATPAAGKTTFCWQLLNQLAESGETCIFCSYEMSALEMYSKTLSRGLFCRDHTSTLTAAEIRRGGDSTALESLLVDLITKEENHNGANLLELRDENIDDLLRILKPYCEDKEKAPVVCLDYLQIVPPSNDKQLVSDKARIDDIVHKLKTFQRETNTTFIVVSSFNRTNYTQQVSFESFKESGNIEYTADVVWAMQLDVVNHFKLGEGVSTTRKKIEDAKRNQPRKVQLKCLKNRQGLNYDCYFDYYAAYDYFAVGVSLEVEERTEDGNNRRENTDRSNGSDDSDLRD